jgi:hypothetical protein
VSDERAAAAARRRRLAVARAAYWLILAVLLAFLTVLQSWEALPWGGGWTAVKLVVLLATGLLPIATWRRPRWHVAIVLGLLAAGIAFLFVNLGWTGR